MSGILHKAEDALHLNHHSHDKSAEHGKGPEHHDVPADKPPHSHDHKHGGPPHQEEHDRADFDAARHYDHAMRNSHGAGVGFEE